MITLYAGGAIYLLALSALRWRVSDGPSIPRLMANGWLAALGTLLWIIHASPLADIAAVTGSFLGLATFDALRYGQTTQRDTPRSRHLTRHPRHHRLTIPQRVVCARYWEAPTSRS